MIRKVLLIAIAIVVVAGIVIQLVPYGRVSHTNPAVVSEPTWDSPQTQAYFSRACADCHSNETKWPWYSNVAPMSWLIQRHVDEGREAFNVSEWRPGYYEAEEAAELVQNGQMPIANYLMLHPEARFTATERDQFIQGLTATFGGEGREGRED